MMTQGLPHPYPSKGVVNRGILGHPSKVEDELSQLAPPTVKKEAGPTEFRAWRQCAPPGGIPVSPPACPRPQAPCPSRGANTMHHGP